LCSWYRRVSLSESFGCDDYFQQQKQSSTVEAGDTSENCFQIGLPQLENDSILIVGRKGTYEGADAIEFLFEQVEDMSKVVGVGLQRSKVVVTEQFGLMVIQISEHVVGLVEGNKFCTNEHQCSKAPNQLQIANVQFDTRRVIKKIWSWVGGIQI
jgi:hypothetical protein